MLAADDGKPGTMAAMHEVRLLWNDPTIRPTRGSEVYDDVPDRRGGLPRARRKASPVARRATG